LPILPGDLTDVPPQCIVRFLSLAGFTPDKALVIPHMMQADGNNIDWDLTYANSSVAPNAQMEMYHRVGEIYSARAIDQGRAYGAATLVVFETGGMPNGTLSWTYRYGWKNLGAHIGLLAAADNHEQMPGVNDDLDLDNVNYHSNEPGGNATVLAPTRDRAGVWSALQARNTYATSGIRAVFNYLIDGMEMGTVTAKSAATASAQIDLAAGMNIQLVELLGAHVGDKTGTYQTINSDRPAMETYQGTVQIPNPVMQGAPPEEWLYYVRAFFKVPGSPIDSDEALWSSPIWITWSR
jgi:hypothetical protein